MYFIYHLRVKIANRVPYFSTSPISSPTAQHVGAVYHNNTCHLCILCLELLSISKQIPFLSSSVTCVVGKSSVQFNTKFIGGFKRDSDVAEDIFDVMGKYTVIPEGELIPVRISTPL